jgi:hypothetical protein
MHVAKDSEVDTVFVEERFECGLAGFAAVAATAGRIPGAMTANDEPWGYCAVDGCEVCIKKFELLTRGAKWASI